MERWHIYFFGRVQGVGFRFTSKQVADQFSVSGWVKNLPNGSVEMIVEGEVSELKRYIAAVKSSTHGNVTDTEITKSDATSEFSGMEIRT